MKKLLLKTMLLLCALVVGSGTMWGTAYVSYNGSTKDTSTTISSSNVSSGTAGKISWTGTSCTYGSSRVNIAANGSITFTASSGYNITKIIITSGSSSSYYGTWTSSPSVTPTSSSGVTTFDGLNASSVTVTTSTAFRCTSASDIKVYYEAAKTNPTISFSNGSVRVGRDLDLSTLFSSNSAGGVTYSITAGGSYASIVGSTLTGVAEGSVTVKATQAAAGNYNAGEATATISVNAALALSSIAITTAPTKTTYTEGETFDPTGMVVAATYSDSSTDDVTASCTYTPSTSTALTPSNTAITVSYTENAVEKTTTQSITVNAASAYTVTFSAGTGSCGTSSLTEASAKAGVTLPTATIGVTGWSFAGWATASTTNTEDKPTLYAAGATYKPTEDCTLYAVYKFTEGTEGDFIRATKLAEVKAASQVILVNGGKTLTTDLSDKDALSESESVVTAADKTVFTLSGNDTDGYVLSSASGNIGASSLPSTNGNSQDLAITSTNSTWTISTNSTANTFTFLNKGGTNVGLEYYSTGSKWVVYKSSSPTTSSYYSTKVYIPNWATVYNSNPAAIVNPTIAWTTSGDKSLYLQNTNTYDNAANVTGIAKTATYTSSDATVASVSEVGVVTALKVGSTTITAKVAKEVGVNTEASVTYVVTVKDASNVAGLKAMYSASQSPAKAFSADLTDAVVTYVKGSHAYIQDASGAIYASCGTSLTAGQKINGAVTGTITAPNAIDQIVTLVTTAATVTDDGVIPEAIVKNTKEIDDDKAELEGKLVKVQNAKVTQSLTSSQNGKIKTGTNAAVSVYAPDNDVEALEDAEGTFYGYVSLYSGTSVHFNIYEQSQIILTKNAPTAQTLIFASDAVELDEDTDDYDDFTGQAVTGNQGSVTYSKVSDTNSIVTSINASTGAVVLSGNCGTATIKATAAEKEVTVEGVTTPYTETEKTYTITVRPRYTVTFSANGVETELRQASYGATIAVPSPSDISGFKFMGWSTSTVALTDEAPSMESLSSTITPEADDTYYAVYAVQTVGDDETSEYYKNTGSTGTSGGVTASGTTNSTASNGNPQPSFNMNSSAVTLTGINVASYKAASLKFDYKAGKVSGAYTTFTIKQFNSSNAEIQSNTVTGTQNSTYETSSSIDMKLACTKVTITATAASTNSFIDNIIITITQPGVSYDNYCTTVPAHVNIAGTAGYTTYVATDNVSFPGLTAYIATAKNSETVTLTSVEAVPAGTAVVVKGDKGVYLLDVEDAGDCDDVTGNLLLASDGSAKGNGSTIYSLAKLDGKVGFYQVDNDVTIPAGKAYIVIGGGGAKSFLTFDFDEVDGIGSIDNGQLTMDNERIFRLDGTRVNGKITKKGLYIRGGRKVVVR